MSVPAEEGALAGHHDVFLVVGVLLLLLLHHVDLLEALEREGERLVRPVLHQLHAPEPAHAHSSHYLQVFQFHVFKF